MPINQWFRETETLYITGERTPGLGPTLADLTFMDGFIRQRPVAYDASLGFYNANGIVAEPDVGREALMARTVSLYGSIRPVSGFNHVYRGGLSTLPTFMLKFGIDAPIALGDVEDSMRNAMDPGKLQLGQRRSMPVAFNYPEAVRIAIETAEQKQPGAFMKVHGYDLTNYRAMPFTEVQRIGRPGTSKDAGIPELNWKLVHVLPGVKQELLIEVTRVPFVGEGNDLFSAYLGPGWLNPGKLAYAVTGGRGGSGIAGEALKENSAYSQRKFGPGDNDWEFRAIEGMGAVVDEVDQRIADAARRGTKGFVFAVPTTLNRNFPVVVGQKALEKAVRENAIPGELGERLMTEKTNLLYFESLQTESVPAF
jgi:hypothetical protein